MKWFKTADTALGSAGWFFTGCIWTTEFQDGKKYLALVMMCLACRIALHLGFKNDE